MIGAAFRSSSVSKSGTIESGASVSAAAAVTSAALDVPETISVSSASLP